MRRTTIIECSFWWHLIQHIPDSVQGEINHEQPNPRDEPSHKVSIIKNTKLHKITNTEEMFVNSAHHQAVKKLGKDLIVNCFTERWRY